MRSQMELKHHLSAGSQSVSKQWGYYTASRTLSYTDIVTPLSFSKCLLAFSLDCVVQETTTWPGGVTAIIWNINASKNNKIRFFWERIPAETDGASWIGVFS